MKREFETKRRTKRKNPIHTFRANARRRKQRVAATASDAELDSHVPNINVGRALVVITLLHLVAIGGIIVHNKWFDGTHQPMASKDDGRTAIIADEQEGPNRIAEEKSTPVPKKKEHDDTPPEDIEILSHYLVQTGDNYERIASAHEVTERDLRRVNKDVPLRAGRILRIPAPRLVAEETEEMRQLRANERYQKLAPKAQTAVESAAPKAVLIKPKRNPNLAQAPRAQLVSEAELLEDSGTRYTVQAGDTVWRISQRFSVQQDALLSINGLDDPRKLSAGKQLIIPR